MEDWITLGQLLDILNPDESIDIFVTIKQHMMEGVYEGVAGKFPTDYYEEYKDFPVSDFGTANNNDKRDNDNIGLQITLVIPETYKYNNYTLKKLLDTLGDMDVIDIYDSENPFSEIGYKGLKKNIPVTVLRKIENREVAFVRKTAYTYPLLKIKGCLEIILQ